MVVTDFSYSIFIPKPIQTVKIAEFDWNIQGQNLMMSYKMMNFSQRRDFFSKLVDNREQQKNMLKHPLNDAKVKLLPESTWNLLNGKIESAAKKVVDGSVKTMAESLRLVGYDAGALAGVPVNEFGTIKSVPINRLQNCHFGIVEDKGTSVLVAKQQS